MERAMLWTMLPYCCLSQDAVAIVTIAADGHGDSVLLGHSIYTVLIATDN